MDVQHDLPTTTITYFEEKRIDRGFYFGRVINRQKFLSDEIDVALIFDPVREVGVIRHIVPGKDPIEVSSDSQQLVVVAERNVVTAIVVADSVWGAMEGRRLLNVEWDEGPNRSMSSVTIYEGLRKSAAGTAVALYSRGDVSKASGRRLESAPETVLSY